MPPLDYELVYRVKQENPDLTIIVNGGIAELDQAEAPSGPCRRRDAGPRGLSFAGDAGRRGCALLRRARPRRSKTPSKPISYYVERQLAPGVPLNAMTKHMLGLFSGRPGARLFRRHLSENATRRGAGLDVYEPHSPIRTSTCRALATRFEVSAPNRTEA